MDLPWNECNFRIQGPLFTWGSYQALWDVLQVCSGGYVYIKFGKVRCFKNDLKSDFCGRWRWSDCEHLGTSTKENSNGESTSFGFGGIQTTWLTVSSGLGTDSKILVPFDAWTHLVWCTQWVSEGLFIVWTCPTGFSTQSIRITGKEGLKCVQPGGSLWIFLPVTSGIQLKAVHSVFMESSQNNATCQAYTQ